MTTTPWDNFFLWVFFIVRGVLYLGGVGLILVIIFSALNWVHETVEENQALKREAEQRRAEDQRTRRWWVDGDDG